MAFLCFNVVMVHDQVVSKFIIRVVAKVGKRLFEDVWTAETTDCLSPLKCIVLEDRSFVFVFFCQTIRMHFCVLQIRIESKVQGVSMNRLDFEAILLDRRPSF